MRERIIQKLQDNLHITQLEVIDESYLHHGHSGHRDGGETHFHVTVVSPDFTGKSKVARHKMIYAILEAELKERIHALGLVVRAPEED